MDDPWDLRSHIGLERHDIATFALIEIMLLQHICIPCRRENGFQAASYLLLEAVRLVRQSPEIGCRRFLNIAVRIDSSIDGLLEST